MGLFDKGGTGNQIMDPLDLFGGQAGAARDEAEEDMLELQRLQREEAAATLKEQTTLMNPWMARAKKTRETLNKRVASGELDVKPFQFDHDAFQKSPEYKAMMDAGMAGSSKMLGQDAGATEELKQYGEGMMDVNEFNKSQDRASDSWGANADAKANNRNMLNTGMGQFEQSLGAMANFRNGNANALNNATQNFTDGSIDTTLQYAANRNNSIQGFTDMMGSIGKMGKGAGNGAGSMGGGNSVNVDATNTQGLFPVMQK